MSAVRVYGANGRPEWRTADEGYAPRREPGHVQGSLVVGTSAPSHSGDPRTGAHSRREPKAAT